MRTLIIISTIIWLGTICFIWSCQKDNEVEKPSGYGNTLQCWFSTESFIEVKKNDEVIYSQTPISQQYFSLNGFRVGDEVKIHLEDNVGFLHAVIPFNQRIDTVFSNQWDGLYTIR